MRAHLDPQEKAAITLMKACQTYLEQQGLPTPNDELRKAAKAVVWWRYCGGDDAWDKLKEAIGRLEDLVGRPTSEQEIY